MNTEKLNTKEGPAAGWGEQHTPSPSGQMGSESKAVLVEGEKDRKVVERRGRGPDHQRPVRQQEELGLCYKAMIPTGTVCFHGTFGNVGRCFGCHNLGGRCVWGLLLAYGRKRVALNILQGTGQPPQQRMNLSLMLIAPRLRKPAGKAGGGHQRV